MFDILMYLFENYIHSEMGMVVDQEQLADELTQAGLPKEEVFKALAWIEKLAELQYSDIEPYLKKNSLQSIRVYTDREMEHLDSECRGFLHFLEQVAVLSAETREMVIDRVMEIESEQISLERISSGWILMVLFNVPGQEHEYSQMEGLLFDETDGVFH